MGFSRILADKGWWWSYDLSRRAILIGIYVFIDDTRLKQVRYAVSLYNNRMFFLYRKRISFTVIFVLLQLQIVSVRRNSAGWIKHFWINRLTRQQDMSESYFAKPTTNFINVYFKCRNFREWAILIDFANVMFRKSIDFLKISRELTFEIIGKLDIKGGSKT